MTAPRRLALVGCGRLAERGYLPALEGLPGLAVVALVDPDPARRAALAALVGPGRAVEADDLPSLLAEHTSALDGVLVASPVGAHVADAGTAAAAGLTALVEKPPAPTAGAAASLTTLAPAPVLGFNRRFDPAAARAHAAARSVPAVELRLVLRYRRPAWGAHTVRDDALLDLGPHLVDWARWISGRTPTAVRVLERSTERCRLEVQLAGGRALLEAATDQPYEERIEVRDGRGSVLVRSRVGGVVDGLRSRLTRGGRPDRLVATLRAELAAYERLLHTGDRGDLGRPADGTAVMTVLDAARTAPVGGPPVPLPPET